MENEYKQSLSPRVTLSDLYTIRRVLHSYTKDLSCNTPPSPTRDELLLTVKAICERITAVNAPRESKTPHEFDLSPDELTIVDNALRAYIASIGQSVPPSEERDEIMRGCETLRVHLMAGRTLPGPSSP